MLMRTIMSVNFNLPIFIFYRDDFELIFFAPFRFVFACSGPPNDTLLGREGQLKKLMQPRRDIQNIKEVIGQASIEISQRSSKISNIVISLQLRYAVNDPSDILRSIGIASAAINDLNRVWS